jgi:geranylgeranyl reductase family protein
VETCDVVIAGGGPAGSACAWSLRRAGLDVVVVDSATFPRDKVCAGWITPQAIQDLRLDVEDYRRGRTFQPITGFRVGLIGRDEIVETTYDRPVSFGIRRCEFDHYLLQRSGARLHLGARVAGIRRTGDDWVVNESLRAPMLVGAAGHFCPVARMLNGTPDRATLVSAQEVEFAVDGEAGASFAVLAERPELYFSPDLGGYGWCFRKQGYLNVGFGRLGARALPRATADFVDFLKARRRIPTAASWRWRGHAYLTTSPARRRVVQDGVILIGDAAGLAYPQSGEGIRPAIESGLIGASAILQAAGRYTRERLEDYEQRLRTRFGISGFARILTDIVPDGVAVGLAPRLLKTPWFVRHVLLHRWFLHAHEPGLAAGGTM